MRTFLMVSMLMAGCAASTELIRIDYQFLDNPVERRIDLTYRNESDSTMCLLPEDWPNLGGKINQASDRVYLVVGQERFPIEDFNTGYCPQGCAFRVAPGKKISASIPYSDFRLPERLNDKLKKLEFSPTAYKCTGK